MTISDSLKQAIDEALAEGATKEQIMGWIPITSVTGNAVRNGMKEYLDSLDVTCQDCGEPCETKMEREYECCATHLESHIYSLRN